MPTFTLDELVTPMTRAEAQASIYRTLQIVGVDTTSWKSGAVVRTVIVATSAILAALSELQAQIAKSGFIEKAERDWLTLVAKYVYGVERIEATYAVGIVRIFNDGGGIFTFDPGDLIFRNPSRDKSYRSSETVSLGGGPGSYADVPVIAVELGADSTALPGEITELTTAVLQVRCNNLTSVVGYSAESDPQLRIRCSEKLGSISPMGPWDAYTYAARTVTRPDGSSLGVTRVRIDKDGYGTVTTTVARADGPIAGDPDDISTDLGIIADAIRRRAEPLAVNAVVQSAAAHALAVTYEVWLYNTSGRTTAEVERAISEALRVFASTQPIGGQPLDDAPGSPGYVWHDGIRAALSNALPEIFHVELVEPPGDVLLTPFEVAVHAEPVAIAIHQVPPPEGYGGASVVI